jgi:hypothetical protein|nr:MAG TPA: hypothetical protein [Caudoviricetes sp.]
MAVSMQEKLEQLKLLDRLELLDKVIQNFGFENKKTIFFAKVVENFTLSFEEVLSYYQRIMN